MLPETAIYSLPVTTVSVCCRISRQNRTIRTRCIWKMKITRVMEYRCDGTFKNVRHFIFVNCHSCGNAVSTPPQKNVLAIRYWISFLKYYNYVNRIKWRIMVKTASKQFSQKLRKMSSNMCGFEWCKKRSILYRAVNVTSQHANAVQYFTLLKQENRFILGLNTAKNTPCTKKCIK